MQAASMGEFVEHLAIHDGIGAGLVRHAHLDGDVVGKVRRPRTQRDRLDRLRQRGGEVIEFDCRRASHRRPHLGDECSHPSDVKTATVVVNRSGGHPGLDEFDASTIDDNVAG